MKKVKVSDVLEQGHSAMNDAVMDTAGLMKDAYFIIKIDDLVRSRGITQKQLAQMTGMRVGTISLLANGKGISINKVQLLSLMVALRVTKMSDIYEIRLPDDMKQQYEADSAEWIADKRMPVDVKELFKENVLKSAGINDL